MKINPEKIMNINPRTTFEVKPLDINIAKAQYNLIERLEREVPEYGDFAPVIEKFTLKSPRMEVGDVQITCSNVKESETNLERVLKLTVSAGKNPKNGIGVKLASGKKTEILDIVKDKAFFEKVKSIVLNIDETLKK